MAIQERVTSYSVAVVRNDFVPYREVVRLTSPAKAPPTTTHSSTWPPSSAPADRGAVIAY